MSRRKAADFDLVAHNMIDVHSDFRACSHQILHVLEGGGE